MLSALTLFDQIDRVDHKRLVHYRSERALINARSARNALIIVDLGGFVLVHGDRFDLESVLTRTYPADDRGIRAYFRASAAFLAF